METSGDSRDGSGIPASALDRARQVSATDGAIGRLRPERARPARGLVRWLYSSNPFYILSADLVFVGLRMSFGAGGSAPSSSALLLGLAGYTLLMATAACFLIRVGKLWDDLRSLLLLVVMMFLAMALCGDETMAADPRRGAIGCAGGFVFAVVVTEAALRAIGLRLPGWYRGAYYLILAHVFLYPITLVGVLNEPESPQLQWGLFGFSAMAGLVLLPLVPAARGGAGMIAKNGSPWRWPLYPWSLFVVMAAGLGARCYSLCVSFHYVHGSRTIFGPYFLVPIGLAVSLVWLEIAIAAKRRGVMVAAAAAPLCLACLAMTGHRDQAVYLHFLAMFEESLGGSPAYLTLIAAMLFLAYAAARRVPLAWELLALGLAALAVIGPRTVTFSLPVWPRPLPLVAAGLVLGVVAARRHSSGRAMLAAGLLVAGITRGWAEFWPSAESQLVALHLVIGALLAVGALFDDWFADLARAGGALLVLVLGAGAAVHASWIPVVTPATISAWYPLCAIALAFCYGFWLSDRLYLAIAAVDLAAWLAYSASSLYHRLRLVASGLDQIAWGMVFFLIAMTISLKKAGIRPVLIVRSLLGTLDRIRADCTLQAIRERHSRIR
jgi:hypothetical protein